MEPCCNTKIKSGGAKLTLLPKDRLSFPALQKKSGTANLVFVLWINLICWNNSTAQSTFSYPFTSVHPAFDTIFGRVITDNYRWLENVNTSEVQAWLKQQNDLTNDLLDNIPGREMLFGEYKKLDEVNDINVGYVRRMGGRYFYTKTLKGENVGKLYFREGETGEEILLFDPHLYEKEQSLSTPITFRFNPANDGKKIALSITGDGKGDISKVKFMNVDTRTFYTDNLYPVNSPQAWTPDGNGIIYGELQTTDQLSPKFFLDIPLKVHYLGEATMKDKILVSRINNPELKINPYDFLFISYSPEYSYLMLELFSGPQEQIRRFFAPASDFYKSKITWQPLTQPEDQVSSVIIGNGNAYMISRKDAPNRKLVVTPLNNLDSEHTKTLIPESEQTIEYISMCKDFLFVMKTDGMNGIVKQYNFATREIKSVNLPQQGSVSANTFDALTNDCIMWVSSWNQPNTQYKYDPETCQSVISPLYPKITYPGTKDLVVEEIEIKSHDGTMVPLSLVYNKNIQKDNKNIVYMDGYGSYGASILPWFNIEFLPLLNRHVIIAHAHPRGGGEKGYNWHMGGFKSTKPNTWKDFIACAEYLISEGYTSPAHLIGEGTSAGGILIGRAITERPDLFSAAINNVPVSNPLRGENRPNGALDAQEFGTVKDSVEAMGLMEMDAYLHVKQNVSYPAVIAVSGINDTRVPVWQPAKFVAALQSANAGNKPVLLMVNYNSGHWSDEKFVTYRNYANIFSLALWQAGHKDFQPEKY
jgi:prolyl oligopeptidase